MQRKCDVMYINRGRLALFPAYGSIVVLNLLGDLLLVQIVITSMLYAFFSDDLTLLALLLDRLNGTIDCSVKLKWCHCKVFLNYFISEKNCKGLILGRCFWAHRNIEKILRKSPMLWKLPAQRVLHQLLSNLGQCICHAMMRCCCALQRCLQVHGTMPKCIQWRDDFAVPTSCFARQRKLKHTQWSRESVAAFINKAVDGEPHVEVASPSQPSKSTTFVGFQWVKRRPQQKHSTKCKQSTNKMQAVH